jgi:multidrug efflux pump subunit AcrA (membrane-fusion protein)
MKRKVLATILIAVLVSAFLYVLITRSQPEADQSIKVSGNIEGTEVDIGFKVSGRIVILSVEEGRCG